MKVNVGLIVFALLVLHQSGVLGDVGCGAPPQAPNTKPVVLVEKVKVGDIIQQECKDGYGPEMSTPCECLYTGQWDDRCSVSVTCQVNPDPPLSFKIGPYRATNWVTLTWDHPKSLDEITGYEVRCNNYTRWKSVNKRYLKYNYQYGIRPHTLVRCEMRSVKGPNIKSEIVTSGYFRTYCSVPSQPLSLTFGTPTEVNNGGKKMWKYVVSWQPPRYINCASLNTRYPYEIQYPRTSSTKRAAVTNSTVLYIDGDEQVTFTVWARSSNSTLPLSKPASKTIRTPEIIDDHLRRRLTFEANYAVECTITRNPVAKQLLMTIAKQNYQQIGEVCTNVCKISNNLTPDIDCKNSTVTIRWPTDTVYGRDVKTVPAHLASQLSTSLELKGAFLQIVVMSKSPPLVYPSDINGDAVRFYLVTQCDAGYIYNVGHDLCESI